MYKNLVIVMLLSSTMQITCEVGNRVYHEKTDTYEFYGRDIISCTKESALLEKTTMAIIR